MINKKTSSESITDNELNKKKLENEKETELC